MELYKEINDKLDRIRESQKEKFSFQRPDTWDTVYVLPNELPDMVDTGIQEHTEAKFWIEHRSLKEILTVFYDDMMERKKEESIPEEVRKELAQEVESLTVRPEGGTKPGVVEIKYTENYIKLYYPKDDDFRKIVKDHRYSWDGVWKRKINELTGDFPDRAGEIGKALLTGGFTVRFPDMAAKEKALFITDHYEVYIGKEYMTPEKLAALADIVRSGAASNISDAISVYKSQGDTAK